MRREYPVAPIVGVGAVVVEDDRVLLVQRAREPGLGLWSIPGGAVELGETIAQAAVREVREECHIEVEPGGVLSTHDLIERDESGSIRYHYVLIDLAASYVGGQLAPGTDAVQARWAFAAELSELNIQPRLLPVLRSALHRAQQIATPSTATSTA